MTHIEFKDEKPRLEVDVNCKFFFDDEEEKEGVIKELQKTGWDCLQSLANYIKEH